MVRLCASFGRLHGQKTHSTLTVSAWACLHIDRGIDLSVRSANGEEKEREKAVEKQSAALGESREDQSGSLGNNLWPPCWNKKNLIFSGAFWKQLLGCCNNIFNLRRCRGSSLRWPRSRQISLRDLEYYKTSAQFYTIDLRLRDNINFLLHPALNHTNKHIDFGAKYWLNL